MMLPSLKTILKMSNDIPVLNKDTLITLMTEMTKDSLNAITMVLIFLAYTFRDNFAHCMYCVAGAVFVALVRIIIKTYIAVKYQKELQYQKDLKAIDEKEDQE